MCGVGKKKPKCDCKRTHHLKPRLPEGETEGEIFKEQWAELSSKCGMQGVEHPELRNCGFDHSNSS